MPSSIEELELHLTAEEPDYSELAQLGPNIVADLRTLVRTASVALASKATSLAGFIGGPDALRVIEEAAKHPDPRVRIAAAGAIAHFPAPPSPLVLKLLRDPHASVRMRTLKSGRASSPEVKLEVEALGEKDPDDGVRRAARESIGQTPPAKFR
jgi:HEAT repeat protein